MQAQQLIYYNIEPTYQSSIEGSVTAQEMWQRLLAEFADVAASNDRSLLGKFHSYRINPGETFLKWWLLIKKKFFCVPKDHKVTTQSMSSGRWQRSLEAWDSHRLLI